MRSLLEIHAADRLFVSLDDEELRAWVGAGAPGERPLVQPWRVIVVDGALGLVSVGASLADARSARKAAELRAGVGPASPGSSAATGKRRPYKAASPSARAVRIPGTTDLPDLGLRIVVRRAAGLVRSR